MSTETDARQLDELTKWPLTEEEVTVDGVLRSIGYDAQLTHLEKWRMLRATDPDQRTPEQHRLHHLSVLHEIDAVGLMGAIRKLREVSPEAAEEFARDFWEMCDDGSSFGEVLWEWLGDAGLDADLVKLPEAHA